MTQTSCPACGGRRYVRTARAWTYCATCFAETISRTFVQPPIKQTDTQLPDSWAAKEPWPLTDRVVTGDYTDFRYMVWRSLLHHYHPTQLTYAYLDGFRLAEIKFRHDAEYETLLQLRELSLLILVIGLVDPPNAHNPQYIARLAQTVRGARTMHGRPTWVYTKGQLVVPSEKAPVIAEPRATPVLTGKPHQVWG